MHCHRSSSRTVGHRVVSRGGFGGKVLGGNSVRGSIGVQVGKLIRYNIDEPQPFSICLLS